MIIKQYLKPPPTSKSEFCRANFKMWGLGGPRYPYLYSRPTFPIGGHLTMLTHCLGHCGSEVFLGIWRSLELIHFDLLSENTKSRTIVSVLQMSMIFKYIQNSCATPAVWTPPSHQSQNPTPAQGFPTKNDNFGVFKGSTHIDIYRL